MAETATWYTHGLAAFMRGEIALLQDTIKVALLGSTYTPSQSHASWSNVSSHEVSGTGYTAGGEALSNKGITPDTNNIRSTFDADDVTWANSEITARYAVLYDDTASGKPLIALVDFGEEKSSSNGSFTIQWHADGILRLDAS